MSDGGKSYCEQRRTVDIQYWEGEWMWFGLSILLPFVLEAVTKDTNLFNSSNSLCYLLLQWVLLLAASIKLN